MNLESLTYASSGVAIDEGNALVEQIKPLAKSTNRAGVMANLGGFGSLFDLKACGYRDPILVSGTDGVGTKIMLAIETGDFSTIGIDLVAMCVNDLIVQGAEPLFFLDYFASSSLDKSQAGAVIAGIAEGCRMAGAALIGGESAEMPGLYREGDFDLAGFAVGAVERAELLPVTEKMLPGDRLIALPSSGLHSNGFSLVRKVVERSKLRLSDTAPFDPNQTLGAALLTPTQIYTAQLLPVLKRGLVKGLSHITGGGLTENLPRVLPDHLQARVDGKCIKVHKVFSWLQEIGSIETAEMLRTFNCGIGIVLIVDQEKCDDLLRAPGFEQAYVLGELGPKENGLNFVLNGELEF